MAQGIDGLIEQPLDFRADFRVAAGKQDESGDYRCAGTAQGKDLEGVYNAEEVDALVIEPLFKLPEGGRRDNIPAADDERNADVVIEADLVTLKGLSRVQGRFAHGYPAFQCGRFRYDEDTAYATRVRILGEPLGQGYQIFSIIVASSPL